MSNILTEHFIFEKYNIYNLSEIKVLNIWGEDLEDISIISNMPNLEIVCFSSNKISDLSPFTNCYKIKEIYLRNNKISDIFQLKNLEFLQNLKILWIMDNPINVVENYRIIIQTFLPQLHNLDKIPIAFEQRKEKIKKSNLNKGEKIQDKKNAKISFFNAISVEKNSDNNIVKNDSSKLLNKIINDKDFPKIKSSKKVINFYNAEEQEKKDCINSLSKENLLKKINSKKIIENNRYFNYCSNSKNTRSISSGNMSNIENKLSEKEMNNLNHYKIENIKNKKILIVEKLNKNVLNFMDFQFKSCKNISNLCK